ncbi:hypothetical protein G7Y89_g11687 [Cudoniella acicularis]|uniref:Uncharacterized protein n=1 Tax=Cudoniella acicularis TaxID=354080 RepID=A0A8H4VY28_9HELO|nr:hypothetical protein G7Y89_g11687 [Cudoniella acicularis]
MPRQTLTLLPAKMEVNAGSKFLYFCLGGILGAWRSSSFGAYRSVAVEGGSGKPPPRPIPSPQNSSSPTPVAHPSLVPAPSFHSTKGDPGYSAWLTSQDINPTGEKVGMVMAGAFAGVFDFTIVLGFVLIKGPRIAKYIRRKFRRHRRRRRYPGYSPVRLPALLPERYEHQIEEQIRQEQEERIRPEGERIRLEEQRRQADPYRHLLPVGRARFRTRLERDRVIESMGIDHPEAPGVSKSHFQRPPSIINELDLERNHDIFPLSELHPPRPAWWKPGKSQVQTNS